MIQHYFQNLLKITVKVIARRGDENKRNREKINTLRFHSSLEVPQANGHTPLV